MADIERSEAQFRVRNAMPAAAIPLTSVTARCMFEPTLAPTTGRNECQFGPTPLWDHLVGRDAKMPESDLDGWIDKLVRSGQTRQAAASMSAKLEPYPAFEIGTIYSRRQDIHARFGGQQQGGIATPAQAPFIFLFTGASGEQYGYSDGRRPDGVFVYTGEGQEGDMQFRGGNKSILEHARNGKDLMLFEHLGKGEGYRYVGAFACSSFEYGCSVPLAPDVDLRVVKRRTCQTRTHGYAQSHFKCLQKHLR